MKLNFCTILKAFTKGDTIKYGSDNQDMRLGDACVEALLMLKQGEEPPKGKKLEWGILAETIFCDMASEYEETEVTAEDISILKARIETFFSTNVVLRAHRLLEGQEQELSSRKLSVLKNKLPRK